LLIQFLNKQGYLTYTAIAVIFISTLIFFPNYILAIDELSYFSYAHALANGNENIIVNAFTGQDFMWTKLSYQGGTSFVQAMLLRIHPKLIFLSGTLYALGALYLLYRTLEKHNLNTNFGILSCILFLPFLYFSRSLMSEMPSVFLVSLFVYILMNWEYNAKKIGVLSLIAALSLSFREATILLLIFPLIWELGQKPLKYLIALLGGLIGLIPRVLLSKTLYGKYFMLLSGGTNSFDFSLYNFDNNILLYLFLSLVCIPGGLFFAWRYKGKYSSAFQIALFAYLLLHVFYNFGLEFYGFKNAIFYCGRYLIPSLPVWAICIAWFFRNSDFKKYSYLLIIGMSVFIISFTYAHWFLGKSHKQVGLDFFDKLDNELVIYNNTAFRYLNPINGHLDKVASINHLTKNEILEIDDEMLYLTAFKSNTSKKKNYIKKANKNLNVLFSNHSIELEKTTSIIDGTEIYLYRIMGK